MILQVRSDLDVPLQEVAQAISREHQLPFSSSFTCGDSFTNSVYCLPNTERGKVYLKLYDVRFPVEHAASELEALYIAESLGISAPTDLYHGLYKFHQTDVAYLITSEVAGSALIDTLPLINQETVGKVIDLIEKLHTRTSSRFGSVSDLDSSYLVHGDYFEFISDVFDYALSKVGNQFASITAQIREQHQSQSFLFKDLALFVFSHKDLNLKHIFYDEDEKLNVIDWEWSLYLDQEYDYGVFLTSLLTDLPDQEIFDYTFELCSNIPNMNVARLRFHIGRELFFSTVFHHRRHHLTNGQAEQRLKRSLAYLL